MTDTLIVFPTFGKPHHWLFGHPPYPYLSQLGVFRSFLQWDYNPLVLLLWLVWLMLHHVTRICPPWIKQGGSKCYSRVRSMLETACQYLYIALCWDCSVVWSFCIWIISKLFWESIQLCGFGAHSPSLMRPLSSDGPGMLGGSFQSQLNVWNPLPMAAIRLLSSWLTYFAMYVCQDSRPTLIFHYQVLPGVLKVLSSPLSCSKTYQNYSQSTLAPGISKPSYSDGWPDCPPRVSFSSQIGTSKFTLHILSDTPGGSQWLKYILLMYVFIVCSFILWPLSLYNFNITMA